MTLPAWMRDLDGATHADIDCSACFASIFFPTPGDDGCWRCNHATGCRYEAFSRDPDPDCTE